MAGFEVSINGGLSAVHRGNRKGDLLAWARFNRDTLTQHELYATGTTGSVLSHELGLDITRFLSGPLGGDQQVGAGIVEGRIDFVIFFWDPLEPHPHDVDVKALLRIAVVHNVPIACNRATADFFFRLRSCRVTTNGSSPTQNVAPISRCRSLHSAHAA